MTIGDWDPSCELPDQFLEIPHAIYGNDTNWVPENRASVISSFSGGNPYFENNAALVIAEDGIRLAGFFNPNLNIDGQKVAFFGYWETPNNLESNQRVFSKFESWAKNKGAEQVFGPINFSTFGDYRLRIDGFDRPQFLGEPYNPNYYPELLASLGYEVRYKYFTACCTIETLAFAAKMQMEHLEKKVSAAGIEIVPLTPEYWIDNLDQLYPIIDCIFSENFAYTPITFDQFKVYCGEKFAKKFCTKMSNIALKGDKLVAFQLFYPDYSPLVTQIHEPPIPVEDIRYSEHFDLYLK